MFNPGHFYSPIPDMVEIQAKQHLIWGETPTNIPGVDLNTEEQLRLLEEFKVLYKDISFPITKTPGFRYYFDNGGYSYSDAIILNCMIRRAKPKNIIEVGSGFSSCVTLDTNERFFNNSINVKFIEPYPTVFNSLVREEDKTKLIISKLQDVDLNIFSSLEENDILFIDSTHVSKVGSDVNFIFFKILPLLKKGVYVHFHDIFYPFEYPKEWVFEGRYWTEDYLLRAFLQYNNAFKIMFFNTYLEHFYTKEFQQHMPLCLKCLGGSIWIQKK